MTRKVHCIEVDVDGETEKFYYRKPSGRLMLRQSDKIKNNSLSNERSAEEMYAECIVKEDGSPISREEVNAILEMEFEVLNQLNAVLMPKDVAKNG